MQRGQVFKLPSGAWACRFYTAGGKRRQIGGFRTKAEASARLEQELRLVRLGSFDGREEMFDALVEQFLDCHDCCDATRQKLGWALRKARDTFGSTKLKDLRTEDLRQWRQSLPESQRWDVTRALKQVLNAGVTWRWIESNPAQPIRNRQPDPRESRPFATWQEVMAVTEELDPIFRAIPVVAVGTGLRPGEWIALEWRDLDLSNDLLYISRMIFSTSDAR